MLTREQCTPCQVPGFFLKAPEGCTACSRQDMSMIRSKLDEHDLQMRRRVRERLDLFVRLPQILVDNNPVSCILHPAGSARA